ncbi:SMI1/KNR4 family protein [Chondromyces crocatus]|uniref:Knr4/Smi1-like domain-containing protein n=1 Tax=Chondromyces crocatus TaxID=52 RepID=A0A0K1ENQ6_CHOCO|nr:SMI1/KNR4 family protein [Chondromyces crocatus]AKT42238.1 uncharacterized protein CMC5_064610 [Chondromyces crocatus]
MLHYRPRFEALIEDLRRHPCIQVLDAAIPPGLSEERIEALEREAGGKLPAAAHTFFREMNGVTVFWRAPRELPGELWMAYIDQEPQSDYFHPEQTHGILIPPLEEIVAFTQWPREFVVLGDEPARFAGDELAHADLARRIFPFDFHLRRSNEDAAMALVLFDDPERARVVKLISSGCLEPKAATTDFASYLELLVATRGEQRERERFEAWSSEPLTFDAAQLAERGRQYFRVP